uniref:Uncharacterized protein n=1 Tax=Anguilla anguilla TaxID=7936 RepID=A0A0E9VZ63_ANGAN
MVLYHDFEYLLLVRCVMVHPPGGQPKLV